VILAEALTQYAEDALQIDSPHIRGHLPLLAVSYGACCPFFLVVRMRLQHWEYGTFMPLLRRDEVFFENVNLNSQVWMSHRHH
jgi:GMP synthase (glutamine-hydrolysing)